jgi:hypothetical protein
MSEQTLAVLLDVLLGLKQYLKCYRIYILIKIIHAMHDQPAKFDASFPMTLSAGVQLDDLRICLFKSYGRGA